MKKVLKVFGIIVLIVIVDSDGVDSDDLEAILSDSDSDSVNIFNLTPFFLLQD